jgi:hypothetical protein
LAGVNPADIDFWWIQLIERTEHTSSHELNHTKNENSCAPRPLISSNTTKELNPGNPLGECRTAVENLKFHLTSITRRDFPAFSLSFS